MKRERLHGQPPIANASRCLGVRILVVITSVVLLQIFAGCAHRQTNWTSWREHSELSGGESIVLLNKRANDPTEPQAVRARAVFMLFAQHISPSSSADEVRRVFTDAAWLRETHLEGVRVMGGWVPVEMTLEDTVFCLHLFPVDVEKQRSPWVIYFRLSGRLRDEEGFAFLRGKIMTGDPKLVEFALCFPESSKSLGRGGRIEHFSAKGITVFNE